MSQAATKHFDNIEYEEGAVLTFAAGLPAFEHLTRFLIIEHAGSAPLVFLQSLDEPGVCLPALPMLAIDPAYELSLTGDDLEALGFGDSGRVPGANAMGCFAVVSIPPDGPATANLLAPVVVNLAARRAVQAVRPDGRYSHRHVLGAREAAC